MHATYSRDTYISIHMCLSCWKLTNLLHSEQKNYQYGISLSLGSENYSLWPTILPSIVLKTGWIVKWRILFKFQSNMDRTLRHIINSMLLIPTRKVSAALS